MSNTRWLKSKYLKLVFLSGVILGLLNFITKTTDFWNDWFIGRLSKPEIIQFSLSPKSQGYEENLEPKFGVGDEKIRTFSLMHPLYTSPSLILSFTIRNKSKNDVIINKVIYDVLEIGEVKSLTPGPIKPSASYDHNINWSEGRQPILLDPLFSIPAENVGAFTIGLTVRNADYGAGIIVRIIFITSDNDMISTEKVQIYLPNSSTQFNGNSSATKTQRNGNSSMTNNKREISLEDLHQKFPGEESFINNIFITSNLYGDIIKYKLDYLDQDLLFVRALLSKDYESFVKYKSDVSGMTYEQMFENSSLRNFWNGVRENFIFKDAND